MAVLCENCASKLRFDPDAGKLVCSSCGGKYSVEGEKAFSYANHSASSDKLEIRTMDFEVKSCQTCGARLSYYSNELNTVCSYCGNSDIRTEGKLRKRRPDAIIPFTVSRETAERIVWEHIAELPFVEQGFAKKGLAGLCGIYIPYYIVNADYKSIMHIQYSDEVKLDSSVLCVFDKLILEASDMLPDDISVAVEPYDISELKVFNEGYLQGFSADVADTTAEEMERRADDSVKRMILSECRKMNIVTKGSRILKNDGRISFDGTATYALFPVWIATVVHNGYRTAFLVNGQTGKVYGTPPYSEAGFRRRVILTSLFTIPLMALVFYVFSRVAARVILSHAFIGLFLSLILTVALIIAFKSFIRHWLDDADMKDIIAMSSSKSLIGFMKRRSGNG